MLSLTRRFPRPTTPSTPQHLMISRPGGSPSWRQTAAVRIKSKIDTKAMRIPSAETNSSHLKMDGWNASYLVGWLLFTCHVSFREGISKTCSYSLDLQKLIYLQSLGVPVLWLWQHVLIQIRKEWFTLYGIRYMYICIRKCIVEKYDSPSQKV